LKKSIKTNRRYLEWRSDVFKRDNYHCSKCGKKGYLEAHHIIPFSIILKEFNIKNLDQALKCKELWDIGNGITLCSSCHVKVDKYRAVFAGVKND
jgi:5-methylcytosine-specific restriction endonuclease McrA